MDHGRAVRESPASAEDGHVLAFVVDLRGHSAFRGVDGEAPVAVRDRARRRAVHGLELTRGVHDGAVRPDGGTRIDSVQVASVLGAVEKRAVLGASLGKHRLPEIEEEPVKGRQWPKGCRRFAPGAKRK